MLISPEGYAPRAKHSKYRKGRYAQHFYDLNRADALQKLDRFIDENPESIPYLDIEGFLGGLQNPYTGGDDLLTGGEGWLRSGDNVGPRGGWWRWNRDNPDATHPLFTRTRFTTSGEGPQYSDLTNKILDFEKQFRLNQIDDPYGEETYEYSNPELLDIGRFAPELYQQQSDLWNQVYPSKKGFAKAFGDFTGLNRLGPWAAAAPFALAVPGLLAGKGAAAGAAAKTGLAKGAAAKAGLAGKAAKFGGASGKSIIPSAKSQMFANIQNIPPIPDTSSMIGSTVAKQTPYMRAWDLVKRIPSPNPNFKDPQPQAPLEDRDWWDTLGDAASIGSIGLGAYNLFGDGDNTMPTTGQYGRINPIALQGEGGLPIQYQDPYFQQMMAEADYITRAADRSSPINIPKVSRLNQDMLDLFGRGARDADAHLTDRGQFDAQKYGAHHGGTPTRYRWRYSTNSHVSDFDPKVTSSGRTVTISNLTANTNYWVDVRAENSGGNSAYSGNLATSTTPAAPGVPTNVSAAYYPDYGSLSSTEDILDVTFAAPVSGGTPTLYRAERQPQHSSNWIAHGTRSSPGTISVGGTGFVNRVRVRAENSYGVSNWVEVVPINY